MELTIVILIVIIILMVVVVKGAYEEIENLKQRVMQLQRDKTKLQEEIINKTK